MSQLSDYRTAVNAQVPGTFPLTGTATQDQAIAKALREHSKHRPRRLVDDLDGDGGFSYDLADLTGWEDDFSQALEVEYPVDDAEEVKSPVAPEDWKVYQAPAGMQLHFLADKPAADEAMRITYTARHTITATTCTVPAADEVAVQVLAAAYFCRALSAVFAQNQDSTIAADSVDQGGKRRGYETQAKAFEAEYYSHLGITPGQPKPASLAQDMDVDYSNGMDRLTHPRRRR